MSQTSNHSQGKHGKNPSLANTAAKESERKDGKAEGQRSGKKPPQANEIADEKSSARGAEGNDTRASGEIRRRTSGL